MENRKNKVKRERYKGFEIVTDTEDRQREQTSGEQWGERRREGQYRDGV